MPMSAVSMMWTVMMTTMMVMLGRGRGVGQACTLGDIQAVQPDIDFPVEKMDGRWLVNKVYGNPAASGYLWYTIDVVPTPTGMAFFANVRTDAQTCMHSATVVNATENGYLYTADTDQTTESVVVAAVDPGVERALWYWCPSTLRSATDPCNQPVVLAVGRTHAPEAAAQWLTSLSAASLPCYNATDSLTAAQGKECSPAQTVEIAGRDCKISNFPVQQDLNVTKYVSRPWKEVAWMPPPYLPTSAFYQNYAHKYTLLAGGFILIDITARNPQDDNKCIFDQAILRVTDSPGEFLFYDPYGSVIPYNVIDVEYDHYALVFGCVSKDNTTDTCINGRGNLWSRDVTLSRHYHLRANARLLDMCVNPAAWYPTQQDQPACSSVPVCTGAGSILSISPAAVTVLLTIAFFIA